MNGFYKQLQTYGDTKTNQLLSKHTTFKIGGPADFFVTVHSTEKLVALLQFLDAEGEAYVIVGGGSNMLVSDEGFRGVAVKVHSTQFSVLSDGIEADAGCMTVAMAQETIKAGLTGFEWGIGLPGTIGGAVRGNAGAMGGAMKDVIKEVDVYKDGEVMTYTNNDCQFEYRDSIFKHDAGIVLKAVLELQPGGVGKAKEGMSAQGGSALGGKKVLEYLQYRNKTQPQGFASTGCIFKNSSQFSSVHSTLEIPQQFKDVGKISAGWLVEKAGMKGAQVGQAKVSDVHGNFIVNLGGATAADVLTLIEQIKQRVYNTSGIELEEEIHII